MFENIRKELALFSEGHRKGSQSNNDLHKAMNAHITNLKLLGGPIEDIKNALPSKDKEKSGYTFHLFIHFLSSMQAYYCRN